MLSMSDIFSWMFIPSVIIGILDANPHLEANKTVNEIGGAVTLREQIGGALLWAVIASREMVINGLLTNTADTTFIIKWNSRSLFGTSRAKKDVAAMDAMSCFCIADDRGRLIRTLENPDPSKFMRIRVEIEDDKSAVHNPSVVLLSPLVDDLFWKQLDQNNIETHVLKGLVHEASAAVSSFSIPDAKVISFWPCGPEDVTQRVCLERLLNADGKCVSRTCGKKTKSTCSKCSRATYCSKDCQVQDYRSNHRDVCASYRMPKDAVEKLDMFTKIAARLLQKTETRVTPRKN